MTTPSGAGRWSDEAVETAQMMSRARRVLAYGGLDGVVQRPLFHEGGVFPQFAVAAEGCWITDSTGRRYVDWANGWGPVMLGYRHPAVEDAIRSQLAAGPTLSFMHPIEVEVAEQIVRMVPCAEMVAFGKNGSDALNAAVRLSRAVTGRDVILQHGFHGFHEWYVCKFDDVAGIPRVYRDFVAEFPYNDLDALRTQLEAHDGQVAAIVMEPTNTHAPAPGYLEGVRELASAHGALLVFDEVLTAFRLAPGGAQEVYGVRPDLACLGKSMGNGMPISALVGAANHMSRLPSTGYGMTFRGETLSLAAARAVLTAVEHDGITDHLAAVGDRVRREFEPMAETVGVPCRLLGPPSRMTFGFEPHPRYEIDHIRQLFLQECLLAGLVTNGTLLASAAHDDDAVDRSLAAFEAASRSTVRQLAASESGPVPVGGSPDGPRAWSVGGIIDHLDVGRRRCRVDGWVEVDHAAPSRIEITLGGGESPSTAGRIRRRRVRRGRLDRHRFRVDVPRSAVEVDGELRFVLSFTSVLGTSHECHVRVTHPELLAGSDGPFPLGDGVLYL